MAKKKKQYYAVVKGWTPGIYKTWEGAGGAAEQVRGVEDAIYRGFYTEEEMLQWLADMPQGRLQKHAPGLAELVKGQASSQSSLDAEVAAHLEAGRVVIFTDGSADTKSRRGGYGAVLRFDGQRKELSGGFQGTTNNRMELMACVKALGALTQPADAIVYSDSSYVVNGIRKGWAEKWRTNGWMRTKSEKAKNADLWAQLLTQCEKHQVTFLWVRGHSGTRENERCDKLALAASRKPGNPVDSGG